VARTPRRRCRILSSALRLRLADAAARISTLADGLLPLFRKWRLDGRMGQAHNRLREEVRQAEGRARDPSGAVIDSQAVKGTGVGGPERGYDGAKRLSGRKRQNLLVDTSGLVLGARVHAASLHDRDGAQGLLTGELKKELPRLELVFADGAYTSEFRRCVEEERGWRVEVPYHRDRQLWRYGLEEKPRGFRVLPRGGGWSREPSRGLDRRVG
jgi:putative transposase